MRPRDHSAKRSHSVPRITRAEEIRLRDNYARYSAENLAPLMGHSPWTIRAWAKRLELRKRRLPPAPVVPKKAHESELVDRMMALAERLRA